MEDRSRCRCRRSGWRITRKTKAAARPRRRTSARRWNAWLTTARGSACASTAAPRRAMTAGKWLAAVLLLIVGLGLGGLLAWRGVTGPPDQARSRLREAAFVLAMTAFALSWLWRWWSRK